MTVDEEGMATPRGRVAIVTGSTRGLGYSIACRFAKVGIAVVVNGRSRGAVEQATSTINEAGGVAVGITADVGNADDVRRLFDETIERLGCQTSWSTTPRSPMWPSSPIFSRPTKPGGMRRSAPISRAYISVHIAQPMSGSTLGVLESS